MEQQFKQIHLDNSAVSVRQLEGKISNFWATLLNLYVSILSGKKRIYIFSFHSAHFKTAGIMQQASMCKHAHFHEWKTVHTT